MNSFFCTIVMQQLYAPTPYASSLKNNKINNYITIKCDNGYSFGSANDIIGCPVIQVIILAVELYEMNRSCITHNSLIKYIHDNTDLLTDWIRNEDIIWAPYCGSRQRCEIHYQTFITDMFALVNYTLPSEFLNTKLYNDILNNPLYFIKAI